MTGRLEGQRMLVLGGGSGIGLAVVRAYLEEGAVVAVVERSPDNAEVLNAVHGRLIVVVGDATKWDVVRRAIPSATGTGHLDNLTCCVGVFDHYASLRQLTADRIAAAAEEAWRINVSSVFTAISAAWPALSAARGSVTLTLSESAFRPVGGGVIYGSSKWALRGAVHHLAADLAPEVRVNGVAPGGTTGTNLSGLSALDQDVKPVAGVADREERIARATLLGFAPTPADHASAYVYLADRLHARVVTGAIINTDGGRRYT